jgi:hypothetical protein
MSFALEIPPSRLSKRAPKFEPKKLNHVSKWEAKMAKLYSLALPVGKLRNIETGPGV